MHLPTQRPSWAYSSRKLIHHGSSSQYTPRNCFSSSACSFRENSAWAARRLTSEGELPISEATSGPEIGYHQVMAIYLIGKIMRHQEILGYPSFKQTYHFIFALSIAFNCYKSGYMMVYGLPSGNQLHGFLVNPRFSMSQLYKNLQFLAKLSSHLRSRQAGGIRKVLFHRAVEWVPVANPGDVATRPLWTGLTPQKPCWM